MQSGRHNDEQEDGSLQAPPKLLAAFSRLPQKRPFVPPTIDETILRQSRLQLSKPERDRFRWRRLVPRFAIVATAIVLILAYIFVRPGSLAHRPQFARGDVNQDGRVDILDAFVLAKHLKAGPVIGAQNDVNGDGVVDDRDVADIASRAVKLEKDHS